MAKIQYIRSSSIHYDNPDLGSSIGKPKERFTDPSLRIMLTIGITGVVIAVIALLLAISATQSSKDAQEELKTVFNQRLEQSRMYIGKSLRPEAMVKYTKAMKAVRDEYEVGTVSYKKLHSYINSVWVQLVSKSVSRALCISFLQEAETLTEEPLPEVMTALIFFRGAEDSDVIIGYSTEQPEQLFPVMSLESSVPGSTPESEAQEIPDYSVD